MHQTLLNITDALQNLSDRVLGATAENRPLNAVYGWQAPAITRTNLSYVPLALISKIYAADVNDLPDHLDQMLQEVPQQLALLHETTIPQLFTGNYVSAIPAFLNTIETLEHMLEPVIGWQLNPESTAIPARLATRIRSIQAAIDNLEPDKTKLEGQIKLIQDATLAAESLPTDLQALKQARQEVSDISADASEKMGRINTHVDEALSSSRVMDHLKGEAEKITSQAGEVLRIATSTGLAAAFEDKANQLSQSMWGWVGGLVLALGGGVTIGIFRYISLATFLSQPSPNWGAVWIQLLLSVCSVAAPVWLAWLATKQISQRFRLSEDYAFKASVAKAYEGYRREASRIDPAFEASLFASALARLDEAPLRLVEVDTHGSPFHELMNSPGFIKAIETVPEFAEAVTGIYRKRQAKRRANEKQDEVDEHSQPEVVS